MESRNDYVIQVKGNRKGLYEWIKHTILTCMPEEVDYTKEKSKGRLENRECYVYKANPEMEGFESCKTIIHIINYGERNKKKYKEHHYYISNKSTKNASYYLTGIRGHWSIENRCHWVKDAILKEDLSRVKGLELSENLSTLRHIVINLYRINNYQSIKKAIEKYTNRLSESLMLINKLHI